MNWDDATTDLASACQGRFRLNEDDASCRVNGDLVRVNRDGRSVESVEMRFMDGSIRTRRPVYVEPTMITSSGTQFIVGTKEGDSPRQTRLDLTQ